MWHGVSVVTKPTADPVSLTELKDRLGIDDSDMDARLTALRRGAVARVDGPSGIGFAMMTQTWRKSMDGFPGCILLPGAPVKSVSLIKYIDVDGAEQTLDAADYRVDLNSEPVRITPAFGVSWPSTRAVTGAVWVDYVLGEDNALDVPGDLIDAVCLLVGHRLANPEAVNVGGNVTEFPLGFAAIVSEYRRNTVTA